jgi:hypothetical protein
MDYSKMTKQEFQNILEELIMGNAATLLTIPGAYELFSEHFNNEVLKIWYERQTGKIVHYQ